jgi:hypothetical protein
MKLKMYQKHFDISCLLLLPVRPPMTPAFETDAERVLTTPPGSTAILYQSLLWSAHPTQPIQPFRWNRNTGEELQWRTLVPLTQEGGGGGPRGRVSPGERETFPSFFSFSFRVDNWAR